jgi:hypothetical protein
MPRYSIPRVANCCGGGLVGWLGRTGTQSPKTYGQEFGSGFEK